VHLKAFKEWNNRKGISDDNLEFKVILCAAFLQLNFVCTDWK
jgi:hypothetical protein